MAGRPGGPSRTPCGYSLPSGAGRVTSAVAASHSVLTVIVSLVVPSGTGGQSQNVPRPPGALAPGPAPAGWNPSRTPWPALPSSPAASTVKQGAMTGHGAAATQGL